MGNCQAVDAASVLIQHPGGKVEKLTWPVTAGQVMKTNPAHYVALLISTSLCPDQAGPVRLTRIKLLRPAHNLAVGQVYRLITAQDVMKGLGSKKQAKMMKALFETDEKLPSVAKSTITTSTTSETNKDLHHQVNRHKQRSTKSSAATSRPRTWQPSLHSISESAS